MDFLVKMTRRMRLKISLHVALLFKCIDPAQVYPTFERKRFLKLFFFFTWTEKEEYDGLFETKFSGISAARIRPEHVNGSQRMYKQTIGIYAQIKTIDAHQRQVRIPLCDLRLIFS